MRFEALLVGPVPEGCNLACVCLRDVVGGFATKIEGMGRLSDSFPRESGGAIGPPVGAGGGGAVEIVGVAVLEVGRAGAVVRFFIRSVNIETRSLVALGVLHARSATAPKVVISSCRLLCFVELFVVTTATEAAMVVPIIGWGTLYWRLYQKLSQTTSCRL
jgi:hypothetical protein